MVFFLPHTPTGCFLLHSEFIFLVIIICFILIGIKGHSIDSLKGLFNTVPAVCVCVCVISYRLPFVCGHASHFHLSFDHIIAILTILMLVNE